MSLDLSRDYLLFDDPLTVSYQSKTAEGGAYSPAVEVPYCQRNSVTKKDLSSRPFLIEKTASIFHLWKDNLSGIVPKKGDRLTHDGEVWVVEVVDRMDRDQNGVQRYRLTVLQGK